MIVTIQKEIESSSETLRLINLPNPLDGKGSLFVLGKTELLQINRLSSEDCHSWFIGDNVCKDGSLTTFTSFNPLYILLPILDTRRENTQESKGRFLSLDDLLHSEEFPDLSFLENLSNLNNLLELICDVQEINDTEKFYRLNDGKTCKWLVSKADYIFDKFEEYDALKFVVDRESSLVEKQRTEFRKFQVVRILSDCLNEHWKKSLKATMGLPESMTLENKYSYFTNNVNGSNKHRDEDKLINTPGSDAKKTKVSTGVQRLAKANIKGMKKLSSFFTKKE